MPELHRVVTTPDGPMDVYEATPDSTARRAIVVIQEAFGVNRHIEDVTHASWRSAITRSRRGAVPPRRRRDHRRLRQPRLHEAARPLRGRHRRRGARRRRRGPSGSSPTPASTWPHTGIIGFCFGCRATFLVAGAWRGLGAAVGFYGGGIVSAGHLPFPPLIDEAATLRTPWLGLFGDQDGSIPVDDVERLREALHFGPRRRRRGPLSGRRGRIPPRPARHYHEASAKDGWTRAQAWFEGHLA